MEQSKIIDTFDTYNAPPLYPSGHGGAVDLGPRRREGFVFLVLVSRFAGAALLTIISPRFQPHLGGDVEKFVGVAWFSRISYGGGGLRIVIELHRRFILLLRLWNGCGLLDPFSDFPYATNNMRLALGGVAAAAHRRHGLEVADEGHVKNLIVIFVFIKVLCTVRCFF